MIRYIALAAAVAVIAAVSACDTLPNKDAPIVQNDPRGASDTMHSVSASTAAISTQCGGRTKC